MPMSILVALAVLIIRAATNGYSMTTDGVGLWGIIGVALSAGSAWLIFQRKRSGRTLARVLFGFVAVTSIILLLGAIFVGGMFGALLGGVSTGGVGAAGGAALGMAFVATVGGAILLFSAFGSVVGFFALGTDSARDYCDKE
jgi:hypothetical protein